MCCCILSEAPLGFLHVMPQIGQFNVFCWFNQSSGVSDVVMGGLSPIGKKTNQSKSMPNQSFVTAGTDSILILSSLIWKAFISTSSSDCVFLERNNKFYFWSLEWRECVVLNACFSRSLYLRVCVCVCLFAPWLMPE